MRRLRHLGAALRLLRQERGMTQRELAHRTGVDPSQLSRYEGEAIDPSLRTLATILEAMNATLGDLEQAQGRIAALAEPKIEPKPHGRRGEVVRSGRRGYLVVEITEDLEIDDDIDRFHRAVEVVDRYLQEQGKVES